MEIASAEEHRLAMTDNNSNKKAVREMDSPFFQV